MSVEDIEAAPVQVSSDAQPAKYAAFISYRHADKAWGDWLHKALESYRVPKALVATLRDCGPVPARLGRVFRDREELGAAHDLGTEIQEALRDSANLIVICSRKAAQSRWVNEEVLYWKRLGRSTRIFAIIVDGEPGDTERECFPPALKYELGPDGEMTDRLAEPLAADARDEGDGKSAALLKLLAGLLGVDYDQLRRRDLEQQRRTFRRFAAIATMLVLVFAGLAATAGWFAYQSEVQRAEAERQRYRAEKNLRLAIDAANTLIFDIADAVAKTEGVQQTVLLRIQRLAQGLLEKLSEGQNSLLTDRVRAGSMLKASEASLASGDTAAALRETMGALDIYTRLAAENPSDVSLQHALSLCHVRIGDVKQAQGDLPGAMQSYQKALTIEEQLAATHSSEATYQRSLAVFHDRIGDVRQAQGDFAGALKNYDVSFAIAERLATSDPANAAYQRDLAVAHDGVGGAKEALGDLPGALASYQAALRISEHLAASDPSNALYQRDLAASHERIGDAKERQNDLPGALKSYQASLEIRERLAASDPSSTYYRRSLATIHERIGDIRGRQGDLAGAMESYQTALTIAEQIALSDPSNALYKRDQYISIYKTGAVFELMGDKGRATVAYGRAIELAEALAGRWPNVAQYRSDLDLLREAKERVSKS